MKPLCSGLLLGVVLLGFTVGCVPSTAQTPFGTSRTTGSGRTWGTARGTGAPVTPFRGAPFREFALTGRHDPQIAFSPDGHKLAVGLGPVIQVWATETGKTLAKIDLASVGARRQLTFSADGNSVMAHSDTDKAVRVWDAASGEKGKDWSFEDADRGVIALAQNGERVLTRARLGSGGHPIYERDKKTAINTIEPWDAGLDAEFSPDHSSLALRSASGRVRLVNAATGKATWDITTNWAPSGFPILNFAPQGKYLLVSVGQGTQRQLAVLGASDGKEWCRVPFEGRSAVLSADGRIVLAADQGMLRMFDLWTEREVVGFTTPSGSGMALAASPDGKQLAVVGLSSTDRLKLALYVTAFPTLPLPIHPKTDLSADEEAEYWTALTSANLFRRKFAEDVFLTRPDQTVAITARRLVPVADIERLRADDLVQNLADPDPAFRARVAEELDRYAVPFQPLLTAAHDKATGDAKAKLAAALKKASEAGLPASVVADMRGLEVLERLGTPAARAHLAKLAAGAKGARLTEAAMAAQKRLDAKAP